MLMAMSETATAGAKDRGGRFVNGGKPGPGRPVGSRSRLGEQFLLDLKTVWADSGEDALRRCCEQDPTGFIRVVASLMPRDLNVNIAVDPAGFVERFRDAVSLLGNQAPPRRLRRPLPGQVIDHER
jgi:hypothetical protein